MPAQNWNPLSHRFEDHKSERLFKRWVSQYARRPQEFPKFVMRNGPKKADTVRERPFMSPPACRPVRLIALARKEEFGRWMVLEDLWPGSQEPLDVLVPGESMVHGENAQTRRLLRRIGIPRSL
jgi:hypothetical protein